MEKIGVNIKNMYLCRMDIQPIAHFESPLRSKFGIPRQSGLVEELTGRIVFEKPFRQPEAVRGLESFDYLWLIWEFTANHKAQSSKSNCPSSASWRQSPHRSVCLALALPSESLRTLVRENR